MGEKFADFHRQNPHVWSLFARFAHEALRAGHRRLSASLITERIRWEISVVTRGDKFKVNNNFRAFYSRLFEQTFPEFQGAFGKRSSLADLTT